MHRGVVGVSLAGGKTGLCGGVAAQELDGYFLIYDMNVGQARDYHLLVRISSFTALIRGHQRVVC